MKPLPRVEPPKVPLPNVVYERRQNPPFENVVFYIRQLPVIRPYQPRSHRLYKLGVWDFNKNTKNNPPVEYAFSTNDQMAMFGFVFKNIVKPSERRRFVGNIKKIIKSMGEQDRLHWGANP